MTAITEDEIKRLEEMEKTRGPWLMSYINSNFIENVRNILPRLLLAYKEQRDYLAGRPILKTEWEELQTQLSAQDATIAKMRECLLFYAHELWGGGYEADIDFGEKARQCLKEVGDE